MRSLRHRNFRLFWCGQLISSIGSWMQIIGQTWLVLQLTHSAWQLGLVGALQSLPVLLFSLVGGVFADRWPKRRVLLCTQAAAMVQALVLWALLVTGTIQIWQIYVLALLLGITSCLDKPTRQAFVVELVDRADLPNAIALNSTLLNVARVVGPALGGALLAASGATVLFLLNALSFLAVLVGLILIDPRDLHTQVRQPSNASGRPTTWQSLRAGVGYVWTTPAVLWAIVVSGLVLLFGSNFNVALPLVATDVLHVGAAGFGILSAASGVGSLVATLWLAWRNRRPTIRGVLIYMLIFSLAEAAFAVSHLYVLSIMLIASVGGAEIAFATLAMTLLQTITPDHLRGRVMSVCILFFDGSVPLGYLLVGWLSSHYGVSRALLVCACLSLLVVTGGWIWRQPAEQNDVVAARL